MPSARFKTLCAPAAAVDLDSDSCSELVDNAHTVQKGTGTASAALGAGTAPAIVEQIGSNSALPGFGRGRKRGAQTAGGSQAAQRRIAEREATAVHREAALGKAAEVVFQAIAGAASPHRDSSERSTDLDVTDGGAGGSSAVITAEALRSALTRFRVPREKCAPEEAEALLNFAAQRAGVSDGPLDFNAFRSHFATLELQVTRDGRVW
mmetsp:Transcript_45024/g.77974  ORF Transcript_45024/g.77974 Transcript_45024/m.77974 type:complete len:208 (+) Transcript_45024:1-624(+)